MLRAILFDLDDTLFDHSFGAREALAGVHRSHECFATIPFEDFARAHAEHLEALHQEVLAGRTHIDAARIERFRRLFRGAGVAGDEAAAAAAVYREAYVRARRAVQGAHALLAALRTHAPIVVVSNNLLAEQRDKVEHCGLSPHIDSLVVSEEVGVAKPDPHIFRIALDRVGARPDEAVMVGDSWAADVAGALAAGIVPVWFNPLGRPLPVTSPDVAELRALEPVEHAVETILGTHSNRANRD